MHLTTVTAIADGGCVVVLGPGGEELSAEICVILLDEGLIDAEGALVADVTVDDIAAFLETQGITLTADALVAVGEGECGALLPPPGGSDGTDAEPGSLVISKFVCTQIEEPTATVSDPVGVAAGVPDEGCVADSADFQIFVNSDFTSEPIDVFVDGTATVNGVPATVGDTPNALFEPAFNVFFEFFIEPGGVTTITVLNPADDGDGAAADDDADAAADDDDEDAEGGVSALPSTGQGSSGGANGSAIVLLFGALSMVALAGGFAWRARRTS